MFKDNNENEFFVQPEYLRTDAPASAEIDLYTALSIFVNKIPKLISSMYDALDTEDITLLAELTEKFKTQSSSVFLTKLEEKANELQNTIKNCKLNKIGKILEELSQMCNQMTLSRPETVSMLVRINEKYKGEKPANIA